MDLHVSQHADFQRREWRLERIGWALLLLFVLAGVAGLLGTGPLSWATSRGSQGLVEVEYQRVTHHEADDTVTLVLAAEAARGGFLTVELTGSWLFAIDRQGISPQPSEETAVPDGVILQFPVEGTGDTDVDITFRAQDYGPSSADVAVGDDRTSFSQLVLP